MNVVAPNTNAPPKIIHGIRGKRFEVFIENILRIGNLSSDVITYLTSDSSMRLYNQAFTSRTANAFVNYEYLEFLGDATLNKAIPWYLTRRFPKLCCVDGVKILARLKIHLISSKVFAEFGARLKFDEFISGDETTFERKNKILEDVFESFFGATELLVDRKYGLNTGYDTCYQIISRLLDTREISLAYTDLYDAKTRLKELFDAHGNVLGMLKYSTERREESASNNEGYTVCINYTQVKRIGLNRQHIILGEGSHRIKIESEQIASQNAITKLEMEGFTKTVPEFYKEIETHYKK